MRGHVCPHLSLGHKWPKQQTAERDIFCVSCASLESRCTTLMISRMVHTTFLYGFTNLFVTNVAKGSTSYPCTNVVVQCLVVTCRRWMCTYAIESHVCEQHKAVGKAIKQ